MAWFSSRSPAPLWPREVPRFTALPGEPSGRPPWPRRHNSPDLVAQLERKQGRAIDTVICCALDSEPGLRLNAAVAARRSEQVVRGVGKLVEQSGASRAWIVVDSLSPPDWIEPIRAALAGARSPAVIVDLPNHYPISDPTMLLHTLAGRRLKPGALPSEQGVILVDAAGAATVGGMDCVPLGVLDHAGGRAIYLEARPGMGVGAALRAAGVLTKLRIARAGDRLRDRPVSPDEPVGGGELVIHLLTPTDPPDVQACIRCGWCADVCPTRVAPASLLEAVQRGDEHLAVAAGRDACIECGLCEQICPARLPLLPAIRKLKSQAGVPGAGGASNSTPA